MKLFSSHCIIIVLLLLLPAFVQAQPLQQKDSLYQLLQQAPNDTARMGAFIVLAGYYDDINPDSGLYYCKKGMAIAEKLDLDLNKAELMALMSIHLMKIQNYPASLKWITEGLEIARDPSSEKKVAYLQKGQTAQMYRRSIIGLLYSFHEYLYLFVGNYEKQIAIAHEAIPLLEQAGDTLNLASIFPDIGDGYLALNRLDSALFYQKKSLYYYSLLPMADRKFEGSTYTSIGAIYEKMGNFNLARENYQIAVEMSELRDNSRLMGNACLKLANLYRFLNKGDSSFLYAKKALQAFESAGYQKELAVAYQLISDHYYDQKNNDSSFAYLRLATKLKDSLDKVENARLQEFQVAAFNQQLALQQVEQVRVEKEAKQKTIAIIALFAVFSTIGFLLYRNNRQKHKANQKLQEKNKQVEQTLNDLRSTQKQLIQAEKMASLGELTAGIAHEIQNPLNFVNNFSDVNRELLTELMEEIGKGNYNEVSVLAKDVSENEQKISFHGKRADAIVKGMLQHSRSSNGKKEPTDINALCDEYLRLAYHGIRAKDNSFNATLLTEFDESLGTVSLIPQDMGRVILNLINNAFYAVDEKKRMGGELDQAFQPTVTVSTKQLNDKIEIRIADNGNGIPAKVLDKIFQPFFTTKPTGKGTGLGLSLSYDIIKAHNGELKVETKEGEGTMFSILLPA